MKRIDGLALDIESLIDDIRHICRIEDEIRQMCGVSVRIIQDERKRTDPETGRRVGVRAEIRLNGGLDELAGRLGRAVYIAPYLAPAPALKRARGFIYKNILITEFMD